MTDKINNNKFRIAIGSGKLGDVDGVSLEVDKWIEILKSAGHEIFTIAGLYKQPVSGVPEKNQILLKNISFDSAEQRYFETLVFPYLSKRPPHLSEARLYEIQTELETEGANAGTRLYEIIQKYRIDVIIAENTNAMPMSLLGGLAVYHVVNRYRVATIFHHHDFWWERSRFSENYIEKLLNRIMPPSDLGTEHVVISSYASHILRSIKRVNPKVITNCENFDTPVVPDEWNSDFRKELGFSADDLLVVQPTRIVPRKRIEDSLRLCGSFIKKYPDLASKLKFIVSLYQGDELDESYVDEIKALASSLNVPFYLISDRVASVRGYDKNGRKLYTTRDVLVNADIATYLPVWEGFGNAFLEAVACRVPVITTTYLVYKTDIKGAGFKVPEIRDRYDRDGKLIIPGSVLEEMCRILTDREYRREIAESNFIIGKKEFGFDSLRKGLGELFEDYSDEIRASRRRLEKSLVSYSV
jgi:glycosyltransferase involved in cell wall biosynthesis